MAGTGSPTVRRRELGSLLRILRVEAGLTIDEVAQRLLCSPSKVSRMETGLRGTSQRDVRDLCDLYGVIDVAKREHIAALAREGRRQAWWQPYDLPFSYATYVGLEAEAALICDYDPGVVPGLLQTADYARAVHEGSLPRLPDPEIDERVQVRRARQEILRRDNPPPPQYQVVIDEAVLHRVIGGPLVMRGQLDRVIEASRWPNVTVQVLGFAVGAHPALDSTFTMLDFETAVPSVVYVEGLAGHIYLERPQTVERYKQVFERLRSISLDPNRSLDLITNARRIYRK